MKKHLIFFSFLLLALASCKSSFEKVRTSGNSELILKNAMEYYDKKEWQKAQTLFELIINNLRGSQNAETAYYAYADTYYQLKDYTFAAYYFKQFVSTYANSPKREEALFQSAYSHYLMAPSYKLEQSESQKAIDELQAFSNQFPQSSRVNDCNKLIDQLRRRLEEKAFAEGELYYNLKQYQSAMLVFDNMLRDYPESPEVEQVRYLLCKSAWELAQNSILEKRADRYREAVAKTDIFLTKYPKGEYTKEVKEIRKSSGALAKEYEKVK